MNHPMEARVDKRMGKWSGKKPTWDTQLMLAGEVSVTGSRNHEPHTYKLELATTETC